MNITRRSVFAAAAASLCALVPITPPHETQQLRGVFKLDCKSRKWLQCRMYEVKLHDIIAVESHDHKSWHYGRATALPTMIGGVWGIDVVSLAYGDLANV